MGKDTILRRALWVSAVYNLGGALLFGFPGSQVGELAGLPSDVPIVYRAFLAFFVVLFGGAYAWLACQTTIDRPLVALSAIGKSGAFVIIFVCWLVGEIPLNGMLAAIGDLVLAGIFTWWLVSARPPTSTPTVPQKVGGS